MESINIEQIMDEIRQDIRERGLENKDISFEDIVLLGGGTGAEFNYRDYRDEMEKAGENCEVLSYRELAGGKLSKIIKKINRRLIAFYIEAIVDDQNKFNKNMLKTVVMNVDKFKELDERIDVLEKKLYESEKRIKELEDKMNQN